MLHLIQALLWIQALSLLVSEESGYVDCKNEE